MGLFNLFGDERENYDFKRLRRDLEDEYAIQSASFSGGFGFIQMMGVSSTSDDEVITMAKREGFNLKKYKK